MSKNNVIELEGRAGSTDPLTELLRTGARQLLQQAIETNATLAGKTPIVDAGEAVSNQLPPAFNWQFRRLAHVHAGNRQRIAPGPTLEHGDLITTFDQA